MYVYALSEMAELHLLCEETELAARYNNKAMQMSSRLIKAFYSQEYGLLADVQGENIFSEHTQCMALLSRKLPEEIARTLQNNLFRQDNAIAQCTIYFSHYYFEVCQTYHRYDMFMKRAEKWFGMLNLGLKTLLERPEPSRSDCHAWSSHILYHFFSTLLGVKPVAAGCRKLLISPNIGDLTYLSGSVPLNTGILLIEYWHDNNNLDVKIDLPAGIEATFAFAGKNIPLESGKSSFSIMTPSYNKILEVQTRDQII